MRSAMVNPSELASAKDHPNAFLAEMLINLTLPLVRADPLEAFASVQLASNDTGSNGQRDQIVNWAFPHAWPVAWSFDHNVLKQRPNGSYLP
jgi:hypothetical protein